MRGSVRYLLLLLVPMICVIAVAACGRAAAPTPLPAAKPAAKEQAPAAPVAPAAKEAAPAAPAVAPKAPAAAPTPTAAPKAPVAAPTPAAAPKAPAAKRKPAGELKIAVPTFGNERWLPHTLVGAEDIVTNIPFEQLLTRHPKTGEHLGLLARSWEVRDGGKVWVFPLRKGVKFHEGWGELTAEDVKFTYELVNRADSASARKVRFVNIDKYELPDSHTLVLHFKKPEPMFQNLVNEGVPGNTTYPQSKKYITTVGEEAADRKPIGTGPFKLVRHVRGDRMEFEAIEDHWRVVPAFKNVIALKVPEDSTRIAMLRAGAVDIIDIGVESAKEMKAAGLKMIFVPEFASVGITLGGQWPGKPTFDPKVPWVGDPNDPISLERARKVRLALQHATDRNAINELALGGLGDPNVAVSMFFPGKPWTPDLKPRGYDPERARQLMKEAGYPNCFEFTMYLIPWPGRAYQPLVGEAAATQWEKELGCKIKRRSLDRAVFATDFRERTYSGIALAFAFPEVGTEPWEIWNLAGHSKGGAALSFEHPKLDAFLDQVKSEADPNKRIEIMRKMAEFIYEGVYRIEIGSTFALLGVGVRVREWPVIPGRGFPHNLGYMNVGWAPPGDVIK